jgi:hypothetical protein
MPPPSSPRALRWELLPSHFQYGRRQCFTGPRSLSATYLPRGCSLPSCFLSTHHSPPFKLLSLLGCFRYLSPKHKVRCCRDPIRCRGCGRSGHRLRECDMPSLPQPSFLPLASPNPSISAPVRPATPYPSALPAVSPTSSRDGDTRLSPVCSPEAPPSSRWAAPPLRLFCATSTWSRCRSTGLPLAAPSHCWTTRRRSHLRPHRCTSWRRCLCLPVMSWLRAACRWCMLTPRSLRRAPASRLPSSPLCLASRSHGPIFHWGHVRSLCKR